ncbi:neuropeptide-like protein 29 [Azospirillum argentinense]
MPTLRSLSLLSFAALLLSGCYVAAGTPGPVYGYGHRSYGYGYYERPQYRHAPPPVVYGRPYYGGYYGGYRGGHPGGPRHHHRHGGWGRGGW